MDKHFQRAHVLLEQGRFDLAEKELRLALAADPDDALAHAFLGLCLYELDRYDEATDEGKSAIRLAPDMPLGHRVLARALVARNRLAEGLRAAEEAVRLDPEDPDGYSLLAAVHLERRQWQAALDAAEKGLALDAEHVACNNLRAMALVKLGRGAEAGATLEATLAHEPENAFSHANQGWALLHAGDHQKALEHFREALRLEPGLEMARAGIVEAMKSRNIVYAIMLRYFLWMSRLSRGMQWAVIIGFFVIQEVLRSLEDAYPEWSPWIRPLLVLYMAFAVMTWIAVPLFNLLLRLDRFGRHVLTREEVVASNWVGACLAPALVCLVTWLITSHPLALLGLIYFGLLLLPLSAIFQCERGWPRTGMILYTIALALVGAAVLPVGFTDKELGRLFLYAFLIGSFLSGFVANFLMTVQPRRWRETQAVKCNRTTSAP